MLTCSGRGPQKVTVFNYPRNVDADLIPVIFVIAAVTLFVMEIITPGLYFLPFGVGAGVAAVAGFLGANEIVQMSVFIVVSFALFLALRPLGRRLNASNSDIGIGADRLIGATGVVVEMIEPQHVGLVRLDREEWRAESATNIPLGVGTNITVTEVRGTRVLVVPSHSLHQPEGQFK